MITTGQRTSVTTSATIAVALYVLDCPSCGVIFAITTEFEDRCRESGRDFYCPNRHVMSWTESRVAKAQRQADAALAQRDAARSLAARESARRLTAERQRAAARGQVTKIKRRVGKGVCPCCTRSFANLAAHMAGQHPDFAAPEPPAA